MIPQNAARAGAGICASGRTSHERAPALVIGDLLQATEKRKQIEELDPIRDRLYAHLADGGQSRLDDLWELLDVSESDENVSGQVNDIVDLAYCARYSSRPPPNEPTANEPTANEPTANDTVRPASDNDVSPFPDGIRLNGERSERLNVRRYALCTVCGSQRLVLVTVRFASGHAMELFKFFGMADASWPHQTEGIGVERSVEVGRVAFHPILDDCATEPPELRRQVGLYRALAFRALWSNSLDALWRSDLRCLYAIMAPHVARYFAKVGIPMQRLRSARLRNDPSTRCVMNAFPRYWRPNGPTSLQPAAYRLDWQINPYSVPAGDMSIPLAAVPDELPSQPALKAI